MRPRSCSAPRRGLVAAFLVGTTAIHLPAQTFVEVGIERDLEFRQRSGASGRRYLPETMGGGLALLDLDGDGDSDLLLVDSGAIGEEGSGGGRSALFRNDDGKRFVDVTERAGVALAGYGMGVAAGDVDGDGEVDLYLTAFGTNALLRNRGDGRFEAVAGAGGADDPRWSTGVAFVDGDLDGDLDLYVAAYVGFTVAGHKRCGDPRTGVEHICGPDVYAALDDRYFENDGRGGFHDASAPAGVVSRGAGLGVCTGDLDDDGWPDLYVANDLTPNFLWHNRGDGTFEEIGLLSGTALGDRGRAEAGMGIDIGDTDGDGRWEIAVTNYEGESLALYSLRGEQLFLDRRYPAALVEPTLLPLSFGVALADLDLDGDLDLAVANGHVRDNAAEVRAGSRFAQPNQLLLNDGTGRFVPRSEPFLERSAVSRGLVAGDLDLDGDLDLVIQNLDDRPDLLENRGDAASTGRFLAVSLGDGAAALGARIAVSSASGRHQRRELRSGCSYQSQGPIVAHFGLAGAEAVDVDVRWPDGARRRMRKVPAGRRLLVIR